MAKIRNVDNQDLLNCLQENNALLKTILNFLEQQTNDPISAKFMNDEKIKFEKQFNQYQFNEGLKYKDKESEKQSEISVPSN